MPSRKQSDQQYDERVLGSMNESKVLVSELILAKAGEKPISTVNFSYLTTSLIVQP